MLSILNMVTVTDTVTDKINPFQHVADFQAAIRFVETNQMVDNSRIALWGSSFAGGLLFNFWSLNF